jgi:lipopolysaccharide/colanic/teichoic acid biosynthesis glycosyltransferase
MPQECGLLPAIDPAPSDFFRKRPEIMPPLLLDPQLESSTDDSPVGQAPPCPRTRSDRGQRVLDLFIGTLVMIVAVPLMGLAMLAVKLTSRGPVIYSQSRLGRYGRPFTIYKIRSMTHNCEKKSGVKWSKKGDTRVTWVGRILRKTHLDELPQLVNILRGDMSLVGPRPERPEIVVTLEQALAGYRDRLLVRPGLTGLAQVQLPPDTDLESVRRKLRYDRHYVETGSVWMDVRLLLSTASHVAGLPFALSRTLLGIPGEPEVEPERSAPVDPNADTAVHSICPATLCEVSVDAARA